MILESLLSRLSSPKKGPMDTFCMEGAKGKELYIIDILPDIAERQDSYTCPSRSINVESYP